MSFSSIIAPTRVLVLVLSASAAVVAGFAAPQPSVNPLNEEMVLTFADEFDGDHLDYSVWKSQAYEDGLKRETARGPDNVEVRDGNLRLHVRREARPAGGDRISTWTAGYVYTRETVEPNSYVEARFKAGTASGVNNAFWLACVSKVPTDGLRDRYEIDVAETRLDVRSEQPTGLAHLAWHDWKTFAYVRNAEGKRDHVAQGAQVTHSWDDYHVWGVWLGEREIIYYLNGREVWRGDQHPRLSHQWRTGVGKFDRWFSEKEREAYGRHGQDDWNYFGGLAGDRMSVIFSNLPWPETWTPLTDAAHGTHMAIDYVRVFRPRHLLARQPEMHELKDAPLIVQGGSGGEVPLAGGVELPAESRWPVYFSFVATLPEGGSLAANFDSADGTTAFTLEGAPTELSLQTDDVRVSTTTAFPSNERVAPWIEAGKPMLWLARFTPANEITGRAAVSWCVFPLDAVPEREPFFHANVDANGNTSRNNGWHLNAKTHVAGSLQMVKFQASGRSDGVSVRSLKSGPSFLSVLP